MEYCKDCKWFKQVTLHYSFSDIPNREWGICLNNEMLCEKVGLKNFLPDFRVRQDYGCVGWEKK